MANFLKRCLAMVSRSEGSAVSGLFLVRGQHQVEVPVFINKLYCFGILSEAYVFTPTFFDNPLLVTTTWNLRIPVVKSATLASFEAKDEKQERVKDGFLLCRHLPRSVCRGVGMIFTGSAGTGKTHLGMCCVELPEERGIPLCFTTAPKVISATSGRVAGTMPRSRSNS